MKQKTIDTYMKWKESAKKSDKFVADGVGYTQKEFEAIIGGVHEVHVEKEINIDVEDKGYGDMEQQDEEGDSIVD
tara:strand:- start:3412 stop:3636 length:225 start_codon:yes stop_codon:yes gene_type:complete